MPKIRGRSKTLIAPPHANTKGQSSQSPVTKCRFSDLDPEHKDGLPARTYEHLRRASLLLVQLVQQILKRTTLFQVVEKWMGLKRCSRSFLPLQTRCRSPEAPRRKLTAATCYEYMLSAIFPRADAPTFDHSIPTPVVPRFSGRFHCNEHVP